MQSVAVFALNEENMGQFDLINQTLEEEQIVNGVQETITSQLFVNEVIANNYTHCRVVLDEVVDLQVRALNTNLDQVIIQNSYEVYCNNDNRTIICLSDKKSSERIKKLFEASFNVAYNKHIFGLNDIVHESSNVKKAQFTNLKIQTINGGVLNGNRVDQTELYDEMLQNGVLSTIAVTYPFGANGEVSFSVSNSGSIVLFSSLNTAECLELINELMNL